MPKILLVNALLLTLITPVTFFTKFTLYLQMQWILIGLYYIYIVWLVTMRGRAGIPQDKINDIFKSFEQLDVSLTGQHGSTGLGLSITKYLVEIHGGDISNYQ